jgi:ribonuclease J
VTKEIIISKEVSSLRTSGYEIAKFTGDEVESFKRFITFRTDTPPPKTPVRFKPVHVDHSVPGAYGFIIETSCGNIVYTGDFRLHGSNSYMSEEFISAAKEADPTALIIEGTNVVNAQVSSEEKVRWEIIEVIRYTTGLVMAEFSIDDIDRLRSFYEAAQETDRKLVLSMKQAYLLHSIQKDPHLSIFQLNDPIIRIFTREKKNSYSWEKKIKDQYNNIIEAAEVNDMQQELILTTTFYDMNELIAIRPVPGSIYILSRSEPSNEEMEIDFEKLLNWLDRFGIPQHRIHFSGHALPHHLKWAVREVSPKKVFLVHTERPELYKRFLDDLNIDVVIPEEGESYEL